MIFRLAVNDLHICVKYSFVQCIFGYLFIKSSLNDCYWIFMFVVLLFFSGLRNTEILFLAFILSDGKLSGMFFSYGLR